MGLDVAFDAMHEIKRALTILAILENSGKEMKTSKILKELKVYEDSPKGKHRSIMNHFMKNQIIPWEVEARVGIVSDANQAVNGRRGNRIRSPYKFTLEKSSRSRSIYKEYLKIAFVQILLRIGELDFLDDLLNLEAPLYSLINILDSVSGNNHNAIKLSYSDGKNEIRNVEVVPHSLLFDNQDLNWKLRCWTKNSESLEIPIKRLIKTEKIKRG